MQRSPLQIKVLPAQGQQFSLAHTCGERQNEQRVVRIILRGCEALDLFLGEHLHFPLGLLRRLYRIGYVAMDKAKA